MTLFAVTFDSCDRTCSRLCGNAERSSFVLSHRLIFAVSLPRDESIIQLFDSLYCTSKRLGILMKMRIFL